jgi:MFS transporter, DHA1 family, multidrug resistance protein
MPVFLTVLLISLLSGAEVDLFIPSFPELQRVFNLSPFLVQLTLSANFIPYCLCSLFAGPIGDRFNRKTVILLSLSIFVLGSILCVFAEHFPILILGRFLQGVGMAGPSVLAYVIIADQYPLERQPALLGMLNGIVTFAMAFAPVLGSYVTLYFNWRGNFVLLLILGILSLIAGFFVLPSRPGNPTISLSPKTYWPLFQSQKLMFFIIAICTMGTTYWTFIGMAPIVYMENMNVKLKDFGYYQGAIAMVFSIVSIFSAKFLAWFGPRACLYFSLIVYFIAAVLMFAISLLEIHDPMIITGVMLIFASAAVFPINLFYPIALDVVPDAKSRAAALINAFRLLLTAFVLEGVSYFYTGKFFPLGLALFTLSMISLFFIRYILRKAWAHLS